jgi:hypothetical protein
MMYEKIKFSFIDKFSVCRAANLKDSLYIPGNHFENCLKWIESEMESFSLVRTIFRSQD